MQGYCVGPPIVALARDEIPLSSRPPRNPSPAGEFYLDLTDGPLRLLPEGTGVGELHSQIMEQEKAVAAVGCAGHD